MKAKWYGIYTKLSCEKKVSEILNRRHIENYYPALAEKNSWSFRKKNSEKPLFPSYVFVKVEEGQLESIRHFPGVINLLFWLGQPVVIQDSEIEIMKTISSENRDIIIQKTQINFNKINDGPKISSMEINGRKTFKVKLRSIGYQMITQIESPKLTIISAIQNNNYQMPPDAELKRQESAIN